MNTKVYTQSVKSGKGKGSAGFSLVELLVVIAILAILAAIAIPLFLNQRTKAAQAVVQSDARNVATDLTSLFSNLPPTTNAAVSLNGNVNPNIAVSGSVAVVVGGETVTVTLSPNVTLTKTGNADPAVGSGLKFVNTSNPTHACVIPLPASVPYSWTVTLQPQCGTIVSETGNLIPMNVATGGDVEGLSLAGIFSGNYASRQIVQDSSIAAEGENVIRVNNGSCCGGGILMLLSPWVIDFNYAIPVGVNKSYTFTFAVRGGDTAGKVRVHTVLHTESGGVYSYTYPQQGNAVDVKIGKWSYGKVFFTVPNNVVYLTFWIGSTDGVFFPNGTHIFYDKLGVWEGHGGSWSTPGTPIVMT